MINILNKKVKFTDRDVKAEWYLREPKFRFSKLAEQRNFVFINGIVKFKYCEK